MARYGILPMAMARPRAWPARCWRRRRQARTGSTSPRSKASPAHARFRRASRARGEHRLHGRLHLLCVAAPQRLWATYRERGLVVLGVPSNDFRREPGSAAEIKHLARSTSTSTSRSPRRCMSRAKLAPAVRMAAATVRAAGGATLELPQALIGPDGRVVAAWPSAVDPDAPEITAAVERLLPAT